MTLSARLTSLITVFALLAVPVCGFAQEQTEDAPADAESADDAPADDEPAAEYDPELVAEVNEHFQAGAQHFYDEEYEQAIGEFEAANSKIPNAIFLYNISLAYNRMGDQERALEKAEEAEAMGGLSPDDQAQNRARIAALYGAESAETTATDISMTEQIGDPVFQFSKWGWIGSALAVGGILAYGGVLAIDRALGPELDAYRDAAAREDVGEYERLRDEIKPRQAAGRALFVVGTLALASGVALVVYDLKFHDHTDANLAVVPTANGAALSLSGRF